RGANDAFWAIVTMLPAMINTVERGAVFVFGATARTTESDPTPFAPVVSVIQLLVPMYVFQEPQPEVVTAIVSFPPAGPKAKFVAETEKVFVPRFKSRPIMRAT